MITLTSFEGNNQTIEIQDRSVTGLKLALAMQLGVAPECLTIYAGERKLGNQEDLSSLAREKQKPFYFSVKKYDPDFQAYSEQKKLGKKTVLVYVLDKDNSISPGETPYTLELVNDFSELTKVYELRKKLNDQKKQQMLNPELYQTEAGKKESEKYKEKTKKTKMVLLELPESYKNFPIFPSDNYGGLDVKAYLTEKDDGNEVLGFNVLGYFEEGSGNFIECIEPLNEEVRKDLEAVLDRIENGFIQKIEAQREIKNVKNESEVEGEISNRKLPFPEALKNPELNFFENNETRASFLNIFLTETQVDFILKNNSFTQYMSYLSIDKKETSNMLLQIFDSKVRVGENFSEWVVFFNDCYHGLYDDPCIRGLYDNTALDHKKLSNWQEGLRACFQLAFPDLDVWKNPSYSVFEINSQQEEANEGVKIQIEKIPEQILNPEEVQEITREILDKKAILQKNWEDLSPLEKAFLRTNSSVKMEANFWNFMDFTDRVSFVTLCNEERVKQRASLPHQASKSDSKNKLLITGNTNSNSNVSVSNSPNTWISEKNRRSDQAKFNLDEVAVQIMNTILWESGVEWPEKIVDQVLISDLAGQSKLFFLFETLFAFWVAEVQAGRGKESFSIKTAEVFQKTLDADLSAPDNLRGWRPQSSDYFEQNKILDLLQRPPSLSGTGNRY